MQKKEEFTEEDIRAKFIDPSIASAGWSQEGQIRREYYFTAGRNIVKGTKVKKEKGKRADYFLSYKEIPLAIIEAKSNKYGSSYGMLQGKDYAKILSIPFVYTSNGEEFVEYDDFTGKETVLSLNSFPSPEELWLRYSTANNLPIDDKSILTSYNYDDEKKSIRYYQRIAINKTIEAIAQGKNRILLVMATGTGKTLTAFQIIWKLWKSGAKKRILFLADRNILIDQTMSGDFKLFGDKMIKVSRGGVSKAHEIYLGLYQSMTGSEDWQQIFKQYSKDFFDLVIIDECHRGSAREDSAWREILEYFTKATHIGLTATPKETKEVSNIDYFGEPIYTYSLKQGIEDGFLAPYKVIREYLDKDVEGFRPRDNQTDRHGNLIEDKEYTKKDFNKNIVLTERTKRVAEIITEYLKKNDRFMKTIVFCKDQDHAERMRSELSNCNSDLIKDNMDYVVRITSNNPDAQRLLHKFITPSERYPVIATTSKLMTTGVDAKTCKLIVLDTDIQSMTDFKQIIGRGTRLDKDWKKEWFTIMDFGDSTSKFADPEFDGEAIQDEEYGTETENVENEGAGEYTPEVEDPLSYKERPIKYYVDDVEVTRIHTKVQYLGTDGNLITESFVDYSKKRIRSRYSNLDDFLLVWKDSQRRHIIIKELEEQGVIFEDLKDIIGTELDDFDIICHLAFDKKPLTKKERSERLKQKGYLQKYSEKARKVLEILLDRYSHSSIDEIRDINTLKIVQLQEFGSPLSIVQLFGGKSEYETAINELEDALYL